MRWVKIALNLFLGTLGVGALLILAGHFGYLPTVKPFIVQSGSMAPTIPVGSVVLVRPTEIYSQNDVVTFKQNGSSKNIVTHRILSKQYPDGVSGEPSYLTMGDANEDVDTGQVKQADIIGKVYFTIPSLGYLVDMAKQPKGFILFVIVPATIIVYEELRSIQKELARLFARRRRKDSDSSHPEFISGSRPAFNEMLNQVQHDNYVGNYGGQTRLATAEEAVIERGVPKAALVVPILGCLLVFVAVTASFFLDDEQSNQNVLSASSSFGTPTPTGNPTGTPTPTPTPNPNLANHLVINEVMFNPPNTNACGNEGDAEWVEIYNPTGSSVNLDTWSVGDTLFTDDLPNVLLPSGGFAIVSNCTQSSFITIWALPGGTVYIDLSSVIGNGLNNGGEHMRLFDGATLVDDMSYGSNTDAFSPSVPAPISDHSLEREPDGIDTDTAADFVDRTTPQPGL